jgi:hypothetical protein
MAPFDPMDLTATDPRYQQGSDGIDLLAAAAGALGGTGIGTTAPQANLHILETPRVRSILRLANDVIRIESERPLPNAWVRFWHRALLGWRWERP